MRCLWCQKRIWWWQSKKPLQIEGKLADLLEGKFLHEHSACQANRAEYPSIAARLDARRGAA